MCFVCASSYATIFQKWKNVRKTKFKFHNCIDIGSVVMSNSPGELLQTEEGLQESVESFPNLVICLSQLPQHSHMEGLRHRNQPTGNQSMNVTSTVYWCIPSNLKTSRNLLSSEKIYLYMGLSVCNMYTILQYRRSFTIVQLSRSWQRHTVYPKKYAHDFVVLCFVVVMQSFIMNSHDVFIHIHQGCFAGTGAIVRLPQCQWSKPDGYGKISQCITTTKHSKAKTVCIFLGIYCNGLQNLLRLLCWVYGE